MTRSLVPAPARPGTDAEHARAVPHRPEPKGSEPTRRTVSSDVVRLGPHRTARLDVIPVGGKLAGLPIRLTVCHPETLVAEAVGAALSASDNIAEVRVTTSVDELLRRLETRHDVALVSDLVGSELREILQAMEFRRSPARLLVLGSSSDPRVAAQALEWGAAGTAPMDATVEGLRRAVVRAGAGGIVLDPRHRDQILQALVGLGAERNAARMTLSGFGRRERTVLEFLADGTTVTEIARHLGLSAQTVRACVRTLAAKLGVGGQLQVAGTARELLRAAQSPSPRSIAPLPTTVTRAPVPDRPGVVRSG